MGAYGFAVGRAPTCVLLPASVAVADTWGFGWVFAVGALPVLAAPFAFAVARALGPLDRVAEQAPRLDRRTALAVARPTAVLFAVTMAGGGLLTFVPQIVDSGAASAAVLLVLGVGTALCRWGAGHLSDRYGAARFLAPLLLTAALGLASVPGARTAGETSSCSCWARGSPGSPTAAPQNLTLVVAFEQVDPAHIPVASAGWNIGFDGGTATGAVLVGAIATSAGFPAGLLFLAAACVAALI